MPWKKNTHRLHTRCMWFINWKWMFFHISLDIGWKFQINQTWLITFPTHKPIWIYILQTCKLTHFASVTTADQRMLNYFNQALESSTWVSTCMALHLLRQTIRIKIFQVPFSDVNMLFSHRNIAYNYQYSFIAVYFHCSIFIYFGNMPYEVNFRCLCRFKTGLCAVLVKLYLIKIIFMCNVSTLDMHLRENLRQFNSLFNHLRSFFVR